MFLIHGARERERKPQDDVLVFANEILGQADVFVGNIFGVERSRLFMFPRGLQVFAGRRAVDRIFALGSAADRANFAADSRAIAFGAPLVTDFAEDAQKSYRII
jgi:hypothetical protein